MHALQSRCCVFSAEAWFLRSSTELQGWCYTAWPQRQNSMRACHMLQFTTEGVRVFGPLQPLEDVRMTGKCRCGSCFSSKL